MPNNQLELSDCYMLSPVWFQRHPGFVPWTPCWRSKGPRALRIYCRLPTLTKAPNASQVRLHLATRLQVNWRQEPVCLEGCTDGRDPFTTQPLNSLHSETHNFFSARSFFFSFFWTSTFSPFVAFECRWYRMKFLWRLYVRECAKVFMNPKWSWLQSQGAPAERRRVCPPESDLLHGKLRLISHLLAVFLAKPSAV